MKKQSILFFCAALLSCSINAQIGTYSGASDPIPESASITELNMYNPNFGNSFILKMAHGLTVFNQTHEIILVDAQTYAQKKKIELPKYDGYNEFIVNRPTYTHSYFDSHVTTSFLELNKNFALIYKSKNQKGYAVSAVSLNESLTAPDKPTYLFSTFTKCDGDHGARGVMVSVNDKKDLCLFEYLGENKKTKELTYFYRVYNNNLQLIKADSVVSTAVQPHVTTPATRSFALAQAQDYSSFVYDKGYAMVARQDQKTNFTATDISTKKTYTFSVDNNKNFLTVEKVQSINNDKLVFFGKYFIRVDEKKRSKGGVFKIVYNTKTNAVESQLYYSDLPTASKDEEAFFHVDKTIITPTGACYALISQTIGGQEGSWTKTEVVCLDTDANKWKRQVPIPGLGNANMLLADDNLIISFSEFKGDNTKINYNSYAYAGNYKGRDTKNYNLALLKINCKSSYVTQQSFPDKDYNVKMDFNGQVIGIDHPANGPVYGKCFFFKVILDK